MFFPEKLGRYLLIRKVATGGMAEVFLSKLVGAAGFEKEFAIKRVLPQWSSDKDFLSMLVDEAKIAVQLNHPNLVQVYELAREGEAYYLVMEYVPGVDLRRLTQRLQKRKKTRLSLDLSLQIILAVLDGLGYAHSKKDGEGHSLEIVHRDISPQNILLGFDGTVKITDFGIAKAALRNHETVSGVLKGKFAYMSPEQANQQPLDHRSDLFSAAIVFYEVLTGERLFYRSSDLETLEAVRQCQFSFSPQAEKIIPKRLKEVLLKALARDQEGRYGDAFIFRDEILKFARKSRRSLSRERLGAFVTALCTDEKKEEEREVMKTLTQTPPLLLEMTQGITRSLEKKEVLVQGTVLFHALGKDPSLLSPSSTVFKKFLKSISLGGGVLAGVLLLTWVFDPSFLRKEIVPPAVQMSPPIPAFSEPLLSESVFPQGFKTLTVFDQKDLPEEKLSKWQELIPQRPAVKEEEKKGYLTVQATPWGHLVVDGRKKRETPIRRLPLKIGSHTIQVLHEPSGQVVSSQIRIASGKEMVCTTNFEKGEGLRCGK